MKQTEKKFKKAKSSEFIICGMLKQMFPIETQHSFSTVDFNELIFCSLKAKNKQNFM